MKKHNRKLCIYKIMKPTRIKTKYILLFFSLFILCLREEISIHLYLEEHNYSLTYFEYMFSVLYSGANMSYASVIYLFLLGDMQTYNSKNMNLEIRYYTFHALKSSIIMSIFLVIISFLISLPIGSAQIGWTEQSLAEQALIERSIIPKYIFQTMKPWTAIVLSIFIILLFWFGSALFIQLLSLVNMQGIGIALYFIAIFAGSIWPNTIKMDFAPARIYSLYSIIVYAEEGQEYYSILHSMTYAVKGELRLHLIQHSWTGSSVARRASRLCESITEP